MTFRSATCLFLGVVLLIGPTASGQEHVWHAITREGAEIVGQLSSDGGNDIYFRQVKIREKENGQRWSLHQIDHLKLPNRPRVWTGVGNRQLRLANGDALHGSMLARQAADEPAGKRELTFSGPFAKPCSLAWNCLEAVSQSPGTQCLAEFDFETETFGWERGIGNLPEKRGQLPFDQTRFRSGRQSVKLSSEVKSLSYSLPNHLSNGWINFLFYVDAYSPAEGDAVVQFQLTYPDSPDVLVPDPQTPVRQQRSDKLPDLDQYVQVSLSGSTDQFTTAFSSGISGNRQVLARRAGWHVLAFQFAPDRIIVSIDGDLLANCQTTAGHTYVVRQVEFQAPPQSNPVWIDDFAILQAVSAVSEHRLQYDWDEVRLATGDQLLGTVQDLTPNHVRLTSGMRAASVPWSEISSLLLAERNFETRPVSGWICRVDLQPLWHQPDWRQADHLLGAVSACTETEITLEHSLLGTVTIPLTQILRIRPLFRGVACPLEGRTVHLGDEVKSRFQVPSPIGTAWKRTFFLNTVPHGQARLQLIVNDLEASGRATRESPLLTRLRAGEYITEVHLNQRQIGVLNEFVSGHGTEELPQAVRLDLPGGSLQAGENVLEFKLKPSRDEIPEYDDWEILFLSLEIESHLDARQP